MKRKTLCNGLLTLACFTLLASLGFAEEATEAPADPLATLTGSVGTLTVGLDTVWVLVTAFLVFWMNAGFGCVEAGFCRSKNAVNILGKNFVVFGISSIAFFIMGFAIMFSDGGGLQWFMGTKGFLLSGDSATYPGLSWTSVPVLAKFFFQLVFAGTAATIVSGCVAERIHYGSFMLFSFFLVAIFYPITGHWIWGSGWLSTFIKDSAGNAVAMGDFAGSTVVHSVGGWAGLAGIIVLGPRIGKYRKDGSVHPIPGHSMALAFLGGLILWLGWFGFNPGSTMGVGDGTSIALIVVTTNMACAAGLLSATFCAWLWLGKPDFSMTVNGCLAGLVAITAPCDGVTPIGAIIIGLVAGVIVVFSVVCFDKLRIDDPVGALSVHLVNGVWGTLAVGLFNTSSGLFYGGGISKLLAQITGIVAVGAFTFFASLILWVIVKAVIGLRVVESDEMRGLDLSEMGMEAYPGDSVAGIQ